MPVKINNSELDNITTHVIQKYINSIKQPLKGRFNYSYKSIEGFTFFLGTSQLETSKTSNRYFSLVVYDGVIYYKASNVIDKDATTSIETFVINPYKARLKWQADKFLTNF